MDADVLQRPPVSWLTDGERIFCPLTALRAGSECSRNTSTFRFLAVVRLVIEQNLSLQ